MITASQKNKEKNKRPRAHKLFTWFHEIEKASKPANMGCALKSQRKQNRSLSLTTEVKVLSQPYIVRSHPKGTQKNKKTLKHQLISRKKKNLPDHLLGK